MDKGLIYGWLLSFSLSLSGRRDVKFCGFFNITSKTMCVYIYAKFIHLIKCTHTQQTSITRHWNFPQRVFCFKYFQVMRQNWCNLKKCLYMHDSPFIRGLNWNWNFQLQKNMHLHCMILIWCHSINMKKKSFHNDARIKLLFTFYAFFRSLLHNIHI